MQNEAFRQKKSNTKNIKIHINNDGSELMERDTSTRGFFFLFLTLVFPLVLDVCSIESLNPTSHG